jgi:quercetin dioxygenase-like cupin family protein
MRRAIVVLAALLLALNVAGIAAQGEPELVAEAHFELQDPPSVPFNIVQLVLEFQPNAAVPLHRHGGSGYISILEGELMLIADGVETIYRAGDDFVETPAGEYEGGNPTGEPMLLMVSYLVPVGVETTTNLGPAPAGRPGPTVITETSFTVDDPPADFEVVHLLEDWETGAESGWVAYNGLSVTTLVDGQLAVRDDSNDETVYTASDHFTVESGSEHALTNDGDTPARTVTTVLLPEGAELSGTEGSDDNRMLFIAGAAVALVLVGGVVLLARQRRQAAV